ncbi:RHS repeat-associated core domain-containing protein, partial [Paenibacillus thiaminolyticus]
MTGMRNPLPMSGHSVVRIPFPVLRHPMVPIPFPKVLNRYTYDIWGNPLKQEEQVPNIFRYSEEYWDAATELQYLRARWYDPSIGRFLTEDTYEGEINNPLSLNLYTYVY